MYTARVYVRGSPATMFTTADLPACVSIDWTVTRATCDNPECAACARATAAAATDTPS